MSIKSISQQLNQKVTESFKILLNESRGKNYCLVHRRYFETSWCPDCSRSKALNHLISNMK